MGAVWNTLGVIEPNRLRQRTADVVDSQPQVGAVNTLPSVDRETQTEVKKNADAGVKRVGEYLQRSHPPKLGWYPPLFWWFWEGWIAELW